MHDFADSHKDPRHDAPTALVIEDEAIVRKLIRRMLEPETCRVIEADSGEEGLRFIQRGVPPVDIVLTDLTMPGLNGYAVFEVLTRYRPDLPVGVISAYGGVATTQAQGLGARFLLKPFTGSGLTGLVSALIADARAAGASRHPARSRPFGTEDQHADRAAGCSNPTEAGFSRGRLGAASSDAYGW